MRRVLEIGAVLLAVGLRGEPREMEAIREKFERLEEPIRKEMEARLKPLRQAYANELLICAERLDLEGRGADAAEVRGERARVLELIGARPKGGATEAAAVGGLARLPEAADRLRTREELLAKARGRLNERQMAVAERLTFGDFMCDSARGKQFCRVRCAGGREDGVFRHEDFTAEVRYLMESGKPPMIFDSAVESLSPVERARGMMVMTGGTWYEFDKRDLRATPLAARVQVFYFGTAVFEAEWVRSGEPSRYDQEGKLPWWQVKSHGDMVNLNTATVAELTGLGIKASSAADILRKRPFLTKEEVESRVTGIGKKTYALIEKKLTVR